MTPGISRGSPLSIPDHCRRRGNDSTLVIGPKGGTSQDLFPDYCRYRGNNLTLAIGPKGGKRRLFLRLTFSPNETLFIPINRHVIWETPCLQVFPLAIAYWIVW